MRGNTMITVDAMHNKLVSAQPYAGFVAIDIENLDSGEISTSNVPNGEAAELAREIARATGAELVGPTTYQEALSVLLERIADAADAADEPALVEFLATLGIGFVVDDTPATQAVVMALVGAV